MTNRPMDDFSLNLGLDPPRVVPEILIKRWPLAEEISGTERTVGRQQLIDKQRFVLRDIVERYHIRGDDCSWCGGCREVLGLHVDIPEIKILDGLFKKE
jgi:hypothetical protein